MNIDIDEINYGNIVADHQTLFFDSKWSTEFEYDFKLSIRNKRFLKEYNLANPDDQVESIDKVPVSWMVKYIREVIMNEGAPAMEYKERYENVSKVLREKRMQVIEQTMEIDSLKKQIAELKQANQTKDEIISISAAQIENYKAEIGLVELAKVLSPEKKQYNDVKGEVKIVESSVHMINNAIPSMGKQGKVYDSPNRKTA